MIIANEPPKGTRGPRSGISLPAEAFAGKAFNISDVFGANPARAVRLDAADGAIWAARLDYPDPTYPRTWVSEFYVKRVAARPVEFGTQLTCVMRGDCPPFDITRPNIVRNLIGRFSCEADGRQLTDSAEIIDRHDIDDFIHLLESPERKLPIIAVSEDECGNRLFNSDTLARMVAGAAHVFQLSNEGSWALTREIGKKLSTFSGAVRLYEAGLTDDMADPFQHPLWLYKGTQDPSLIKRLASRVLPAAFLRKEEHDQFPRFAFVQDIIARGTFGPKYPNPEANFAAASTLLRSSLDEVTEERDTFESLAHEEQDKRLAAEAEIERLQDEIRRLRSKCEALEYRVSQTSGAVETTTDARPLTSYDDLEDWARDNLGENIVIHPAALKDCRKNGHEGMMRRIADALIVIRDYWIPAKQNGGKDRRDLVNDKLQELGMEDSACFVNRDEAKKTPGYSVNYEGNTCVLYDHIKYGTGYDNANQIRIYYFWDGTRKKFVVGKMPSHLRNNLTN